MVNYRANLLRWLTYLWMRDNPTKVLDIKQYGSISLAEGDTVELIDYICQSMLKYNYTHIQEDEVFQAITFINFLANTELQHFHSYCLEKGITDTTGELKRGWFYKYDLIMSKEPVDPVIAGLDNKFW